MKIERGILERWNLSSKTPSHFIYRISLNSFLIGLNSFGLETVWVNNSSVLYRFGSISIRFYFGSVWTVFTSVQTVSVLKRFGSITVRFNNGSVYFQFGSVSVRFIYGSVLIRFNIIRIGSVSGFLQTVRVGFRFQIIGFITVRFLFGWLGFG